MDKYIEGNKAAWEEAFDNRDASWGADITERIQKEDYPFFEKEIKPAILAGKRCLIVAHGNSLRALVKYFDNMPKEEIVGVNIPTGVPLVYEFDDNMKAVKHYYLMDEAALKAEMEAVANQGKVKK